MLPLAAILLGNDYVKRGTFTKFFRHMDMNRISGKRYRERMIEATFMWLSKYNLDTAITRILITLPEPSRRSTLDLIEDNINSYIKTSAEILTSLRFPRDYITFVKTLHLSRSFKFHGDISVLKCTKQAYEEEEDEIRMEEDYDVCEVMSTINESLPQNKAIDNLPEWFVNEYHLGKFPSYFIDLIVHRLYICRIQIENDDYPSSSVTSLKIVSVIFGFLKSAIKGEVRYMRYVIRDQNRIVIRELQCIETVNCCKLPSLTNLRKIPLSLRREILNETLGINDADGIKELPPEWRLYFGCIKYWIREQEPFVFHKSNVYAICIGMIFHIIDSKIGLYRRTDTLEKRKGQVIEAIKQKRANDYQPYYTTN
ncbi:protein asteroid-like, partial [Ceratina calcarata]|uniref:Protein asteroid-like n=1 Tax=Ceratina calcarata TaxID=156304 RepID=A0AAJ7IY45_9HYME